MRVVLVGLLLAATLPLLLFAIGEYIVMAGQVRRDAEERMTGLARSLTLAVDEELRFAVRFGQALAALPAVRNGDLAGFRALVLELVATTPDILEVRLLDGHGGVERTRLVPRPDAAPDIGSIPLPAKPLAGPVVGGLLAGPATAGRGAVPVWVPVNAGSADSDLILLLLSTSAFGRLLNVDDLPEEWIGTLIDGDRRVLGRSRSPASFIGQVLATGRMRLGETGLGRMRSGISLDGVEIYGVSARTATAGWLVLVGAPVDRIEGPVRRQAYVMLTLGAGALALGLGLAWMIARQIRIGNESEQRAQARLAALVEERTAALRASEAEARAARQRLEDAVRLFPSAIVFYDPQGRMLLCNEQLKEVYKPFRDKIVPGITMREMMELAWEHGMIPGNIDRETHVRQRMAMVDVPGLIREAEANGRRLLVQDFRTPDGGILGIRVDVTALRIAQKALEQSESRFRDFAAASSDGLWETDAALAFTYVSPNFREGLGLDARAEATRGWADIAGAARGDENWRWLIAMLQARDVVRDHVVSVPPADGGDARLIGVNARPVFGADGSFVGYRGTISDVTERQRAVERLRQSEEQLRLVTENVPAFISYIDAEERYRFVNRIFCEAYHLPVERILGRRISDIMLPSAYDAVRTPLRAALRGETANVAAVVEYPDGRRRDLQATFIPHRVDGIVRGVFTIAVDISGLKNVERALRRSERQLRTIFESEPQCIMLIDRDGTLVDINPAGLSMIEATSEREAKERPLFPLLDPVHHDALRAELDHVFAGETVTAEFGLVSLRGNRRRLETVLVPMRGPDGAIVQALGISSDVTQRRAMEERLRQAQKLEAIGQLTGGVAHDFNNLLSVILVNLDLLCMELEERPESRQICARAIKAAERGASLTQQLLAFARRQHLTPRPVDANDLIDEMQGMLRRMLGAAIEVKAAPLAARWPCRADPGQLENALLNLALNARDAMPSGGRLTLSTVDRHVNAESAATLDGVQPGLYVEIQVSDVGTGMSPEVKARAFEPFFTTKDFGKGSGLGLSMVYGFTHQSGGYVRIDSEPGRGTTIQIGLPAWREEVPEDDGEAPALPAARPDGAKNGHAGKILVVEDELSVREAAVAAVSSLGYRAVAAESAAAAMRCLEDDPEIAALFSDIGLGMGPNGIELARAVRVRFPRVQILLTSGNPRWGAEEGARELDGLGVRLLPKPYRAGQIREALAALLNPEAFTQAAK